VKDGKRSVGNTQIVGRNPFISRIRRIYFYKMYLLLNHKKLDVYKIAGLVVKECYKLTCSLPPEERFNLTQQIRRAALSIKLNIAEGASRKSTQERKRYFEIARGSLIEVEASLEVTLDLNYVTKGQLDPLGNLILRCFSVLSRMISA
jgi:four helix bundle protein